MLLNVINLKIYLIANVSEGIIIIIIISSLANDDGSVEKLFPKTRFIYMHLFLSLLELNNIFMFLVYNERDLSLLHLSNAMRIIGQSYELHILFSDGKGKIIRREGPVKYKLENTLL
uniref:Uncharacterized protein n=1 Tax=Glossina austeni TaxID=7395 RepID=A0A1A9VLB3_GLOAU